MIRMIRPAFNEIIGALIPDTQIEAVCPCGVSLLSLDGARLHWEMGHFDYPDDTLFQAAAKFVSETMLKHLADFPDNTPLRLSVDEINGYVLTLKLGDLRALAKEIIHDWP